MTRRLWPLLALALLTPAQAASGPAIQRLANLPDGAPAFDVIDTRGKRIARIECIWNGWFESDAMAARLMGSPVVMAAILAKGAQIGIHDLGPASFDCVVVRPSQSVQGDSR